MKIGNYRGRFGGVGGEYQLEYLKVLFKVALGRGRLGF